jgi:ethanolamine utilization protein EutN
MLMAMVEGSAITTIKHPTMKGWKVLIVQPLDVRGRPDGDPLLAIDILGAGTGTKVVISNDGKGARELVGSDVTPLRWHVIGIVD